MTTVAMSVMVTIVKTYRLTVVGRETGGGPQEAQLASTPGLLAVVERSRYARQVVGQARKKDVGNMEQEHGYANVSIGMASDKATCVTTSYQGICYKKCGNQNYKKCY